MLTVDGRQTGVSEGLTVPELADMLIRDYGAADAISLDGGGSTTLAMDRPAPHVVNVPSDNPPRAVGSSLAVFAQPALTVAITNPAAGASFPAPATVTLGPE
jgi:exopolysaccharide biosynthesis protein